MAAASAGGGSDHVRQEVADSRARLQGARDVRKKAEEEAQLLANRIALLKCEEERSWKKVGETRRRACDISRTKETNQQRTMDKQTFYRHKWQEIRDSQTRNRDGRERASEMRATARHTVEEHKRTRGDQARQEAQHNLTAKRDAEARARQEAAARTRRIRETRNAARERAEAQQVQKMQGLAEEYEQKLAEEQLMRARTEALVAKLEREEMELVNRLRHTQMVQREAYGELEQAIGVQETS